MYRLSYPLNTENPDQFESWMCDIQFISLKVYLNTIKHNHKPLNSHKEKFR